MDYSIALTLKQLISLKNKILMHMQYWVSFYK